NSSRGTATSAIWNKIAAMGDNLCPDLEASALELQADRVRPEARAREPRPLDRVLPLFDPLLRRPAPVVEGDDLFGRAAQIGHEEADARVQLPGVPTTFATTRRGR